jgi:hypothetical protein
MVAEVARHAAEFSWNPPAIGVDVAHELHVENAPFDGRWWTPDDPHHVVGERLGLIDDIWQLTLFGWLGPWNYAEREHTRPPVIFGEVGRTEVSLLDAVRQLRLVGYRPTVAMVGLVSRQ